MTLDHGSDLFRFLVDNDCLGYTPPEAGRP